MNPAASPSASDAGDFLTRLNRLRQQGEPFAVATVVQRRPPVSTHLGDKAVITPDGTLEGWVGGHCSQATVRRQGLAALAEGRPRLLRLRDDGEEDGGEVVARPGTMGPPAAGAEAAGVVTLPLTCASSGAVDIYIEPYLPEPQLVTFGGTAIAATLCRLAAAVGLAPTAVVDQGGSDGEAGAGARSFGGSAEIVALGDAADLTTRPRLYTVVATMGFYDEDALEQALAHDPDYVGLVASRRRAADIFASLRDRGIAEEALDRVHNPAGRDIGAVTQEEIALSILAEIVAHRRAEVDDAPVVDVDPEALATAADPVCGMDVATEEALHTAEHDGQPYVFCSARCREAFAASPAKYVAGGDEQEAAEAGATGS